MIKGQEAKQAALEAVRKEAENTAAVTQELSAQ